MKMILDLIDVVKMENFLKKNKNDDDDSVTAPSNLGLVNSSLTNILKNTPLVGDHFSIQHFTRYKVDQSFISTVFHVKYEYESTISSITFSSKSVLELNVCIPEAVKIIIAANEENNTAFVRIKYEPLQLDANKNLESFALASPVFDTLFIFNENCKLLTKIIPKPQFNTQTPLTHSTGIYVKNDENIQLNTTIKDDLENIKNSLDENKSNIAKTFSMKQGVKYDPNIHDPVVFFLRTRLQDIQYVQRLNRHSSAKMNGVIIDDSLIDHKHAIIQTINEIQYTFSCMKAVAVVLFREKYGYNYNAELLDKTPVDWKLMNYLVCDMVESTQTSVNKSSTDYLLYNVAKLAQLITFLDSKGGNKISLTDNLKSLSKSEPGFTNEENRFGFLLVPYFMKQMSDVVLTNSTEYATLKPKQCQNKKVVIQHSSSEKRWESTRRRWISTHHFESYGRFFIDIKPLFTPTVYSLKREHPYHNNVKQLPDRTTVSVPVDYQMTVELDLQVYHQDLHPVKT